MTSAESDEVFDPSAVLEDHWSERYPCGCIEDVFLDIAERVPGFGGFYTQQSEIFARVTDLALADTVKAEVSAWFTEARRTYLGLSGEVRVIRGDYGFVQLAEWTVILAHSPLWEMGMNGLDADEGQNRVYLTVYPGSSILEIQAWLSVQGLPLDAFAIGVEGHHSISDELAEAV